MSVESTIARKGTTIRWRKMAGDGGVYNVATSKVVQTASGVTKIKAIIDGFGSLNSQLRGEEFKTGTLLEAGQLRLYTVSNIRPGDVVEVGEESYTAFFGKPIWKKDKIVCRVVEVSK